MKRVFSAILLCAVLMSCCVGAFAATENVDRASDILTNYFAKADTGVNTGDVKITYSSSAWSVVSSIGVSSIAIYKSDGTYVTTIYGSPNNGMIARNTNVKNGTYTYKGTSGVSYYAKVNIAAVANGETEVRTVITNTVRAK